MKLKLRIVMVIVAVLAAACGGDDGEATDGGGTGGGDNGGGGGSVTLTAANFAFQPESLTAAAGDTIEFTNEDDAEHNISAEEAGLDEDVEAASSTTVDLADVEPGTYDFICEYHPDSMKGTLEVTE
ncbi:MAG: cupredoxin domain-containing protein [Actinomycetota bacterium]|nr:cupredoxin domain-containing protein [Actinomycetota bacterium]